MPELILVGTLLLFLFNTCIQHCYYNGACAAIGLGTRVNSSLFDTILEFGISTHNQLAMSEVSHLSYILLCFVRLQFPDLGFMPQQI